uniref:Uncharacterized protein n=1 Tax=Arundo donax TaxID=35708 RepID=A0A0A8YAH2_ARUDO
MAGAVERHPK